MFSLLSLSKKFSREQKPFSKKWSTALLVESTKIESASFPYKTAKSEAKKNLSQRTQPCQ